VSIGERGLMKPDTHKVEVGEIKVKLERKEPILKQWLNRKKMKRRMSERMSLQLEVRPLPKETGCKDFRMKSLSPT